MAAECTGARAVLVAHQAITNCASNDMILLHEHVQLADIVSTLNIALRDDDRLVAEQLETKQLILQRRQHRGASQRDDCIECKNFRYLQHGTSTELL